MHMETNVIQELSGVATKKEKRRIIKIIRRIEVDSKYELGRDVCSRIIKEIK